MKYILEYKADEPLEDVLMRNFTIDMMRFDEKETIELIPGGSEILVNKENRYDFVDKYIEYLFEKQCEK